MDNQNPNNEPPKENIGENIDQIHTVNSIIMDNQINQQEPKSNFDSAMFIKSPVDMSIPKNYQVIDTQCFMKQIDLRCDDHSFKFKEDVQATRYCCRCKQLVCDSCVIEYHNDHIGEAKTKIEDYFRKQKLELEDLRSKINSSIKYKVNIAELTNANDKHEKILDSFFSRRKAQLDEMKNKIDNVINEDVEIHQKLKDSIQVFYNQECYKSLDNPLKENEDLLKRVMNFLKEWETYSKTDKINALKSDIAVIFQNEFNQNSEDIKKSIEAFRGKSISIEKKIEEILKSLAFTENLLDFDKLMTSLNNTAIEVKTKIQELKYDKLVIEKVEDLSKLRKNVNNGNIANNMGGGMLGNMGNNMQGNIQKNMGGNMDQWNAMGNMGGHNVQGTGNFGPMSFQQNNYLDNNNNNLNNMQDNNKQPQFSFYSNVQNNNNQMMNNQNMQSFSNQNNSDALQNNNNNLFANKPPTQNNTFQINKKDYDYELFISLKPKSDELIIFNPTKGFSTTKLNQSHFNNPSDSFLTWPEHSKYVNLGNSILLTGGYIQKQLVSNCYLILVEKSPSQPDKYDLSVLPYGKMKQARERHNIVHLQDRNIVLVCSGFFNSGSEYSDITTGEWKDLGNLNENRGNATICYVNKRYVYIIGGYKIADKKGVYHGNCEYIDMDNQFKGWKMINFAENNLKLSAMGVINQLGSGIFLCGGFDGQTYKKDVWNVDMSNPDEPKLEKVNLMLPGNYIFMHNNFLKIGDAAYNLELGNSAIKCDFIKWDFQVIPFNYS